MRVFSDRWMAVTLILPLPASRWPLPPHLSLKGHLHMALPPPRVPSHRIYTVCTHTCADVQIHTRAHTEQHRFSYRMTLSQPQHLGTERKQSLSRLNPGVSFPLRRSSYSRPPPSDFGHNTDGIVIKFQITFSMPL